MTQIKFMQKRFLPLILALNVLKLFSKILWILITTSEEMRNSFLQIICLHFFYDCLEIEKIKVTINDGRLFDTNLKI